MVNQFSILVGTLSCTVRVVLRVSCARTTYLFNTEFVVKIMGRYFLKNLIKQKLTVNLRSFYGGNTTFEGRVMVTVSRPVTHPLPLLTPPMSSQLKLRLPPSGKPGVAEG